MENYLKTHRAWRIARKSYPSNLYLLGCHNFYKIGIADNVQKRLCQLQIGNPYPIELLATLSAKRYECEDIETALHDGLIERGYHVRGEWFELDELNVQEILHALQKYTVVGAEK
jgi:hypothetical protein